MTILFSPAEVASLAVMSLKRLMVYEATKAETAISQKGTLPNAGDVDVDFVQKVIVLRPGVFSHQYSILVRT